MRQAKRRAFARLLLLKVCVGSKVTTYGGFSRLPDASLGCTLVSADATFAAARPEGGGLIRPSSGVS